MATQQNCPGVGIEYEIFVPAFFALTLNNNENVKDFSIRSNVEKEFGNIDDVIIDIKMTDDTPQYFALQLKHKEKKDKQLIPPNFEAKGAFSLEKYCKAFKKMDEKNKQNYRFILYTNSKYDSTNKEKLNKFRIFEDEDCAGRLLFSTGSESSKIYRFEVNEDTPNEKDVTKRDYEDFFPKFRVYVGQRNFEDMEEEIFGILKNRSAVLSYLDLFRKWHQSRFTNKTIDRETINIHLVDIFLSDFVITDRLAINQSSNLELFQKISSKFDITVINDSTSILSCETDNFNQNRFRNHLENYIHDCKIDRQKLDDDPEGAMIQCMLYLGKKYKIVDRTTQQLDARSQKKVSYYFFEELFFVDFNKSSEEPIYHVFDLYQTKENSVRFVLVGPGVEPSKLSKFKVFGNLNDLRNCDNTLFQEVINMCQLSLQGKDPITLEQLIDSCGKSDFVTVKEILQMLQDDFVVGEEKEILPVNYIPREVSTYVLKLDTILEKDFVKTNILIIDFDGKLEQVRHKFEEKTINIIDSQDFIRLVEIPEEDMIISIANECSIELFQNFFEKFDTDSLLHLKMIDLDTFLPVIFKLRINTPGVGVEYEISVPAYFALSLNNDENVKDFSIRSNVALEFGNMDDVVIDIEMMDDTTQAFAVQLKHKEKKNKKLIPTNFEAKGNFSLEKYCKAFKEINTKNKDYRFILYTNSEYNPTSKDQLKIFRIIEDDDCPGRSFFNTGCESGNIYRFEVNDNTPTTGDVTKEDYEEFFPKFRVYVGQKNFEDMEEEVFGILKNRSAVLSYLDLFRKWHQSRFTNKTIDRETINIHLVDIFLSDFVITDQLPINQSGNLELFKKIARKFDITVINDSTSIFICETDNFDQNRFRNHFENYIRDCKIDRQKLDDDPEGAMIQCMLYLGKKYKIVDRTAQQLDARSRKKMLYYFFEELLFVDFKKSEESIYRMFDLYQKTSRSIKFVLVGPGVDSSKFSKLTVFENLNDLRNRDDTLHLETITTCELSLQGKDRITLKQLLDSCGTSDFISVKEILQMLQNNFVVGEEREILPVNYIRRKLSTFVLNSETILNPIFVRYNTLVINFYGQFEEIQNKFEEKAIDVINIEDFSVLQQRPQNPTVISVSEELTMSIFQETLTKSFTGNLIHLQMIDVHTFLPITFQVNDRKCFNKTIIEEERVQDFFDNRINILCAQPGMGKSTMFKVLKNQLPQFWTVLIDLKAHNMFLKTKHPIQEVLTYFIPESQDAFLEKIKTNFLDRKKIVFFFDGLDELDANCIDNVLDYCEDISNSGLHVWVSSRQNLQPQLTSRFSKYTTDIVEVSEDEQKRYIKGRLGDDYETEKIERLIKKIFSSSDMVNNRQVLGIPLQLYIITQIFLDDKDQYSDVTKNIFVLTKMYRFYFEGRYKHTTDKQESKNPHLMIGEPDDHFEKYETLALQSLLDDGVFAELSLDTRRSRRFLQDIQKKKDPLGIVVKVNSESKAVFDHYTYAEYFACAFLSNNFDKLRILKQLVFSDRYKNLLLILNVMLAEDNPLHLAVIYKDVEQIGLHSDDPNIYDRAGRNPLHLAVSDCVKYPGCITSNGAGWSFSTSTFLKLIETLIDNHKLLKCVIKFDPLQYDKLFNWNCVDYAFVTHRLHAVDVILSSHQIVEELTKYVEEYTQDPPFLCFCVITGSVNLLAGILGDNSISNVTNWLKTSCLNDTIIYCYFHKLEMLRFLLNHGAVVDSIYDDRTPLQLATKKKYLEVIKLLMEFDATIDVSTPNGDTLLHLSLQEKPVMVVDRVAEAVAELDEGDFETSGQVKCKDIELLEFFLKRGVSVNSKNRKGETALHVAAATADLEVVSYLCDNDADIHDVAAEEQTLLHCAAANSNTDVLDFVLGKIPDVNRRNGRDETPLYSAVINNNASAVAFLLDRGADMNICDKNGVTPLYCAANESRYGLVKLFLNQKVSLDEIQFLYTTIRSKCLESLSQMSSDKFDIDAADDEGLTPLHVACQVDFDITKLLIEKDANVNLLTKHRVHPLQFAIYNGNVDVVEILLEKVDFTEVEWEHEEYSLAGGVREGLLARDLLLEMVTSRASSKDVTVDAVYKLLKLVDVLQLCKK